MTTYKYGNPDSDIVLIQPSDDYDLSGMESEYNYIKSRVKEDFLLIAYKIDKWNHDLSPWHSPAVFGKEDFGDGANQTLSSVLQLTIDKNKKYFIGGYSLAGLFSLWSAYQTDVFSGVAAASPSVWFPGFTDYMKENKIKTGHVYLSLGDKEDNAKNPVMATVGQKVVMCKDILSQEIKCKLEYNEGNHFKEPDIRTAKAFIWLLEEFNNEQ